MHVCIYLRKERCGCAAGGRAACNIEAYLYCCGGGAAFFFSRDVVAIYKSPSSSLDSTRQGQCKKSCLKKHLKMSI